MTDAILFACVCVAVGVAYLTGRAHSQIRARGPLDRAAIELRQTSDVLWNRQSDALEKYWADLSYKLRADLSKLHRRAQRAESATAAARREAVGQRKRADWWRSEAKRLGWTKGGEG